MNNLVLWLGYGCIIYLSCIFLLWFVGYLVWKFRGLLFRTICCQNCKYFDYSEKCYGEGSGCYGAEIYAPQIKLCKKWKRA